MFEMKSGMDYEDIRYILQDITDDFPDIKWVLPSYKK